MNKYLSQLEKQAVLGSLLSGTAAHLLQNVYLDKKMRKRPGEIAKRLHEAVLSGMSGSQAAAKRSASFLRGAIIPEENIIAQEGAHLGRALGPNPTVHDVLALHHAARGDIDKTIRLLRSGKAEGAKRVLAQAGIKQEHLGLVGHLPAHKAEELKETLRTSPIGQVLQDATEKSRLRETARRSSGAPVHNWGLAGSVASTAIDPAAGTLNVTKSIMSHPRLQHLPILNRITKYLNDVSLGKVRTAGARGLRGLSLKHKLLTRFGYNAAVGHSSELAHKLGRIFRL